MKYICLILFTSLLSCSVYASSFINANISVSQNTIWCGNEVESVKFQLGEKVDISKIEIQIIDQAGNEKLLPMHQDGNDFIANNVKIECEPSRIRDASKENPYNNFYNELFHNGFTNYPVQFVITLTNGEQFYGRRPVFIGIVNPAFKGAFKIKNFGEGLSATNFAFFIEDGKNEILGAGAIDQAAYKKFYSVAFDDYDFLLLMPVSLKNFRECSLLYCFHPVSNNIENIGLSPLDKSLMYGSKGRLKSSLILAKENIEFLNYLLARNWGPYIGKDFGLFYDGHWSPSTVDGYLSFNGRIEGDKKYAPLELYLMGLIPSGEVPNIGLNYQEIEFEDVVKAAGGERKPSAKSPTTFNVGVIVIRDIPFGEADYAYFSLLSKKLMTVEKPAPHLTRLPLFNWATGGRGFLDTELKLDLREPAEKIKTFPATDAIENILNN